MRHATTMIALFLLTPRLLVLSQTPEKTHADWPPPLVVEHDGPSKATLRPGESLRFTPALRNTAARPIAVTHGSVLFVLEAQWRKPGNQRDEGTTTSAPPAYRSWGLTQRWEYPNPEAPRTLQLFSQLLQPGERYAPAILMQRSEYVVPFDSAGTYFVHVCAYVDGVRLCSRSVMTVAVE
jgi:hypothetical protein